MGRSGNPASRRWSAGVKIEAIHRAHAEVRDPGRGQHLWTTLAMWEVDPTQTEAVYLDTENLLTIEGPGCYKCEEVYSPELAAKPCRGSL